MNRLRTGLLAALGVTLAALVVARADDKKPAPDVFGYSAAFDAELKKLGEITPDEFAKRYAGTAKYLDKPTFNPTSARYFADFQKEVPAGVRGAYDFRINADELKAFEQNGFVVSERMGAASFGEMYYRIYSRDLPVFVTADSMLHAWHRSFDAMLEELEQTYLAASLDQILSAMAEGLPAAHKEYGDGSLSDGVKDCDYFLAVARSLLAGVPERSKLGQDDRVWTTLKKIDALQYEQFGNLFGRERSVDYSQFKVRGHYENSELLKRYFKAMMWCGRIDLRVAGNKKESSPRELGAALVMLDLLKRGKKMDQWRDFDRMIQTFVGKTDSMTFAQLDAVLEKTKVKSPADVKDLGVLEDIQGEIETGKLGLQQIRSDGYVSPFGPGKAELPRSFTVLGQKFALDSWVTAKVVYDEILWDGEKVPRRIPSALDVAFAAFGNDQAVPALLERMKDKDGRKFRDGLNYQHNLAAARNVIDAQDKAVWEENLYTHWLGCLRELSQPTTDDKYPQAMRTQAWAMKSLNTQLASWAQLRHDTILYVKQSYTATTLCEYPHGYVEPVPHFWARLEKMADEAAKLIEKTPFPEKVVFKQGTEPVSLKPLQARQAAHFKNFAKNVATLKAIAEKELAQQEMSKEEGEFIKKLVEIKFRGSGGPQYTGWYFGMFYKGHTDADKWDALVADVHTDVPDMVYGDPGCVVTQGVGNVDLLLITVDSGKNRMTYAGPLLSHYEFEMPGVTRKADSEWRKEISDGKLPPRPAWTKGYLVPGVNPDAKTYFEKSKN